MGLDILQISIFLNYVVQIAVQNYRYNLCMFYYLLDSGEYRQNTLLRSGPLRPKGETSLAQVRLWRLELGSVIGSDLFELKYCIIMDHQLQLKLEILKNHLEIKSLKHFKQSRYLFPISFNSLAFFLVITFLPLLDSICFLAFPAIVPPSVATFLLSGNVLGLRF